jgi:Lysyl oxidase
VCEAEGGEPKYFDCKYQGITAGWADTYMVGIPCRWKDVTETHPGTYNLRATMNPDKILCEGALQCGADANQIWDDTQFMTCSEGYTPQVCEVVQAARCQYPTDALGQSIDTTANNTDLAPLLHGVPAISSAPAPPAVLDLPCDGLRAPAAPGPARTSPASRRFQAGPDREGTEPETFMPRVGAGAGTPCRDHGGPRR